MPTNHRSQLRRLPARGSYDAATIRAILDAGFLAHVGFATGAQPFVIPTLYGREGDTLYFHGSAASRMLHELETGVDACVTVTLVDGLVLARSAFHHSMNYRSVVAFGKARPVDDRADKLHCLRVISEHIVPGRWNDVRPPTEKELKATSVMAFSIEEASAKIRKGGPLDDEEDYSLPVWAGVVPIQLESKAAIPDARLSREISLPDYLNQGRSVAKATGSHTSIGTPEGVP